MEITISEAQSTVDQSFKNKDIEANLADEMADIFFCADLFGQSNMSRFNKSVQE